MWVSNTKICLAGGWENKATNNDNEQSTEKVREKRWK